MLSNPLEWLRGRSVDDCLGYLESVAPLLLEERVRRLAHIGEPEPRDPEKLLETLLARARESRALARLARQRAVSEPALASVLVWLVCVFDDSELPALFEVEKQEAANQLASLTRTHRAVESAWRELRRAGLDDEAAKLSSARGVLWVLVDGWADLALALRAVRPRGGARSILPTAEYALDENLGALKPGRRRQLIASLLSDFGIARSSARVAGDVRNVRKSLVANGR